MRKPEELLISPAPWKICDSGKNNGCIVDAEGAVCASGAATGCPPANARLIAASPKLYAKAYEVAENLLVHLAMPSQTISMNRAEVAAMVEDLQSALAEAAGEGEDK